MSIFTRHRTPQLKATLAIGIALSLFGLGACFNPSSTTTPEPEAPASGTEEPTPEPEEPVEWTPVTPASVEPALDTAQDMNTDTSAIDFLQPALIGWNVGNQLDAHSNEISNETVWGNPLITQELMDEVADAGFGIVRIPVTWLGKIGDAASGYKVNEVWLARVATVAGYVHNAGMKAIINIHHDGGDSHYWLNIVDSAADPEDRARIDDMFAAVWTQIANYFKNHGDWLIFEGVNEIHDGGWGWRDNRTDGGLQYAILNQWNQTFVDAVRATGGNNAQRYLGIAGYVTSPQLTMDHLVLPTDTASNRLMVTVHFYDPPDFAIAAKVPHWGKTGTELTYENEKEETIDTSWGQEAHVVSIFDALKAEYIDQGIPVYLGEYGAVHQTGYENYRRYYMEYVTKTAKDRGLVPIYWDNGSGSSGAECFGLFNRDTKAPYSHATSIIEAMMRAVTEDYTLEEVAAP